LDSGVGVSGLRSAFQRSGAQTLQMSLFEIPVSESSSFSETFFDSWLKNDGTELAKARAHHQAQLEQLDAARKKRLPPPLKSGGHPFWWAGIVLIGNPN
jgi:CHAT domain-containing protein